MRRGAFIIILITVAAPLLLTQASGQQKQGGEARENKILTYFPVGKGRPSIPDNYKVTSIEQLLDRKSVV